MPTSKDFSVEDEAYLATIAAEPKMTMDEVGADIEEHGHVPVTNENMTQDPFTAKGSLANALDNCLSSETDLEETTFTRDNNNQNPDMSLENPTDDFRDQTRGEVEGVSDTPQNTYVPPPTSEPTVQQDSAVQVKDSLAEALDSIAMDAVGSTSNEDKEVIEEYSEETASYVPRKAPDIPESLGGDPNKADANGLVYITRTFKVDPSKYISNNYRPINTAQAGNQNPSNVTVKSEAVDITEEEKLSDLGSPEARESAKEPDEPTHKEEADAAKDANKEIKKDEKKAEDEISEKAVLDYATFIDGSSFLCLDEIDEIDYSQIAMDAGPKKKVTRENCATTFNQCRAKNPLYCRFHGPKLLEADIKTQIKATVGPGCVVGVTKDKNAKDKYIPTDSWMPSSQAETGRANHRRLPDSKAGLIFFTSRNEEDWRGWWERDSYPRV